MSRETSEASGKTYGLERVCRVLEFPRSTSYAQRQAAKVVVLDPARRGPKPKVSELDLLAAIRVSRARVLRLMRENQLLSPHRRPQGGAGAARRDDHHGSPERDVGHRRHSHRDRR